MTSRSSDIHNPVVVARVLLPDDANPAGNVHGGTILRLMEEAGMITSMRYLADNKNADDDHHVVAAMVRFENMSFHQPVFVGEVASLSAHVVFTSPHSILVKVVVTAENLQKGKTRVTNSGELWYVPLVAGKDNNWHKPVVAEAPQLPAPTHDAALLEEHNQAKQSYQARKQRQQQGEGSSFDDGSKSVECLNMDGCLCPKCRVSYNITSNVGRTPAESEQELCQMVLPGDCGSGGVAFGGFVMKLMDNAAGCSAFRHCRTNVVTVAISAMDFSNWIRLGDICTIRSKVVFCSNKTLEIQLVASVASIHTIGNEDTLVAKGRFIFASLDVNGKAIPVPRLKLETDEDFREAYLGQQKYEAAKRARVGAAASRKKRSS